MEAIVGVLAGAFYKHPVPGFIVTAIVCGSMFLAMAFIAYRNFGPPAKRALDAGSGAEPPQERPPAA